MAALTNPRRELFAQLLFQGYSMVQAYEKAGYRRHQGNGCMLAKQPEILARLAELREGAAEIRDAVDPAEAVPAGTRAIAARAKVTAESLVEMARANYDLAMENKQCGAVNGAIREMGVLTGIRIERAEVGTPGEFENMSDDELMADIEARFERLRAETQHDQSLLPRLKGSNGHG